MVGSLGWASPGVCRRWIDVGWNPSRGFSQSYRALVSDPSLDELFADHDTLEGVPDDTLEQLQVTRDPVSGALLIVAIHSTRLGPAFGGIRRKDYPSPSAAIADAAQLATHMSLKCAIQGVPGGGGKAVIFAPPGVVIEGEARVAAYRRLGECVDSLGGRFYTGPDVGTEPADLAVVAAETGFVTVPGDAGPGDLAEPTALGVFAGIRAVARRLKMSVARERSSEGTGGAGDGLDGVEVVVQGLGAVGWRLAERLHQAGARLKVSDVDAQRVERAVQAFGASALAPEVAATAECDIYAPCALGAVVTPDNVPSIRARAIAGSANNVLATKASGDALVRRGILYAPDFVINSGALVHGALFQLEGKVPPPARIESIGDLLDAVFDAADASGNSPERVATAMAMEKLAAAPSEAYFRNRK